MFEETQKKITGLVVAQYSETRIQWDNTKLSPTNEEYWIAVTVQPGTTRRASLGKKYLDREPGVVFGRIFGPTHKGIGRFYEIADIFAAIFRLNDGQISGAPTITFQSSTTQNVGLVDTSEGTRYQVNVTVPFEADHTVGG